MGRGLQSLCKQYGSIELNGEAWLWDYVQMKARKKSEMSKRELKENERIKLAIARSKNEIE